MQTVRFLRRRNLGNFEHTELDITGGIPDGTSPAEYVSGLMLFAYDALYEKGPFAFKGLVEQGTQVEVTKVNRKTGEGEGVVITKPKPESKQVEKVTPAVKETPKQEETVAEEAKPQEEKVAAEKPRKPEQTRVTKAKAGKTVKYDRKLDTHKNLLGDWLDEVMNGWRDDGRMKQASSASKALHENADFLDSEGEILPSFKENFLAECEKAKTV